MVDTGVRAELQNSIRQAQDQLMQMGQALKQMPRNAQTQQLDSMVAKAGNLLREAQERCEQIM